MVTRTRHNVVLHAHLFISVHLGKQYLLGILTIGVTLLQYLVVIMLCVQGINIPNKMADFKHPTVVLLSIPLFTVEVHK